MTPQEQAEMLRGLNNIKEYLEGKREHPPLFSSRRALDKAIDLLTRKCPLRVGGRGGN